MKQRLRHLLIRYSPEFLLEKAKDWKKTKRRKKLASMAKQGGISKEQLIEDFIAIGVRKADVLLVHSSLSKIGFVNGGAETVISALTSVIGEEGTLLMPSFPAEGRNKRYLENNSVFDVRNTPSKMGSITELFRKQENVHRSLHPTDSICAKGPQAIFLTEGHFGQLTPYNEFSPFRRLCDLNGRILMLGTTLNGACTNLHTLEDAVDFPFPVYASEEFDITVIDEQGNKKSMHTKVHNPEWSAKRNCDALKPLFESEGILVNGKIGGAESMLINANGMLNIMIRAFHKSGVTMYTPYGTAKKNNS